jgi:hypothetical protein
MLAPMSVAAAAPVRSSRKRELGRFLLRSVLIIAAAILTLLLADLLWHLTRLSNDGKAAVSWFGTLVVVYGLSAVLTQIPVGRGEYRVLAVAWRELAAIVGFAATVMAFFFVWLLSIPLAVAVLIVGGRGLLISIEVIRNRVKGQRWQGLLLLWIPVIVFAAFSVVIVGTVLIGLPDPSPG